MASYSLAYIAEFLAATLKGNAGLQITGIARLECAKEHHLSFVTSAAYVKYLSTTKAGVVLLRPSDAEHFSGNTLLVDDPYLAYAKLSVLFAAKNYTVGLIHSSAVVAASARLASDVTVGANATVADGAILGKGVVIGAGCSIGEHVQLGDFTRLADNVTLYDHVVVGKHALFHSGCVIGADGFGFALDKNSGTWCKIHQLGCVEIGDNVEIGACSAIDRGALGNTVIAANVIIDNLVQVGHNCSIGKSTAIAAHTAIAGSTSIGQNCTIAGAVAIAGHLNIADNVHISGMSMVSKSIQEAGSYSSGTRAAPTREWRKNAVRFNQLNDLALRVKALEVRLKQPLNQDK